MYRLVLFTEMYECFALLLKYLHTVKEQINLIYIIINIFVMLSYLPTWGHSWTLSWSRFHGFGSSKKGRLRLHNTVGKYNSDL